MEDEGQLTCLHTHVHTSHIRTCTQQWPVCVWGLGPPGSIWRPVASARVQVGSRPSIPVGVTLLLLVAQVLGSGSVQLGKGFLKGTSKLLGKPHYLLLISLFGEPALPSVLQNAPGEE